MNERLNGKSALVTGAASGIGLGIATRFVEEGANVLFAIVEVGLIAPFCCVRHEARHGESLNRT